MTITIPKKQLPTSDELLTSDQVAEWLNVSQQTIRRWWRKGYMPQPRRFGRRLVRWRRGELENWIRQNEDTTNE